MLGRARVTAGVPAPLAKAAPPVPPSSATPDPQPAPAQPTSVQPTSVQPDASESEPADSPSPPEAAAPLSSPGARRSAPAGPRSWRPGDVATWAPPALALGLLVFSFYERGQAEREAVWLVLVTFVWALFGRLVSQRITRRLAADTRELELALQAPVRRSTAASDGASSATDVRPGEELFLEAGSFVPVDAVVTEGSGVVRLHLGSVGVQTAEPGLRLPASAELVSGSLRVVCTASGADRTFFGIVSGARARETPLYRLVQRVRSPGAFLVALGSGALTSWTTGSWQSALIVLCSTGAALASALPSSLVGFVYQRGLLELGRLGIDFGPDAVDRAGQVNLAVFCARGTVLSGEPEVAEIHALRGASEEEVLALAAGAESVATHPAAASIRRAAHERGVIAELARGHEVVPGMGVVCYSQAGQRIVVGTRELMLREKVSVAVAEETLRKLENRGKSGIVVSRGDHVIGILALYDAIVGGARAAIQLLGDAQIEPVLLSGEARFATEALGRALSIEHVRPEVAARDRALEVRRLVDGGATVAVVGHSPLDDSALSAASIPVVLRGFSQRPQGIAVLSGNVLLSGRALLAAHTMRRSAFVATALYLAPAVLGILGAVSLLFPAVIAPMTALLGGLGASLWTFSRRAALVPGPPINP